jgi:putative two-component system response regulator
MPNENSTTCIMVVDDSEVNLRLLTEMLSGRGYRVKPFSSGEVALKAAQAEPPDLVLLDIEMPGMNGFEVCTALKTNELLREIPVLFISALHETETKVSAFKYGALDYITKPFRFDEVDARVKTHLKLSRLQKELEKHNRQLEDLVAEQVRELSDSQMATIIALAKLAESRDDTTALHIERVRTFCKTLAQAMLVLPDFDNRLDEAFTEDIYHASALHDIGKVGIPDAVLLKPGRLLPMEFEIFKTHTVLGAETLGTVHKSYPKNKVLRMAMDIARHHHEKWNGSGYPDSLSGTDIPLSARIMALADVYDALCSKRPYKEAFSHAKALEIITRDNVDDFDPEVMEAFLKVEKQFAKILKKMKD